MSAISVNNALRELFSCPISHELMEDPVLASCGHTFERIQIEGWLSLHPTCPLDRDPVTIESLRINYLVKDALEILARQTPAADDDSLQEANPVIQEANPVIQEANPVIEIQRLLRIVAVTQNLTDEDLEILRGAMEAIWNGRIRDQASGWRSILEIPQKFVKNIKKTCGC